MADAAGLSLLPLSAAVGRRIDMFGSHLSIAGGLHNALLKACELHMDCVQLFTQNQRQWRARSLQEDELSAWHDARKVAGLAAEVSHGSYLVNPASPDPSVREKSIAALRAEMLRCETLDVGLLVIHPGSHMGAGEGEGLTRLVRSLDRVHRDLPGLAVRICLETTAGQGTGLGWRFEQLRDALEAVVEPARLGICIDSAHMLAAGYDLTSAAGARATLDELDHILGLELVHVVHVNDSKVPRGSRVDRHEHLGHGHIPGEAFAVLINHASMQQVPKILETPKETTPEGLPWDVINLSFLKGLRE